MVSSYLEQVYAHTMVSNIEKIDYKLIELIEEQNKDRELFNEEISLEHPNIKPYIQHYGKKDSKKVKVIVIRLQRGTKSMFSSGN